MTVRYKVHGEKSTKENLRFLTMAFLLIVVALLSDVQFFAVFDLPSPFSGWCTDSNRTLLFLASFAAAGFASIYNWYKPVGLKSRYVIFYIVVLVAFAAEESIYTTATYSGEINQWGRYFVRYASCLLAYPLLIEMLRQDTYRRIFNCMSAVAGVYCVFVIVQSVVYNASGMILFDRMITTERVMERSFGLRMYLMGGITQLALLYSFVSVVWGKISFRERFFHIVVIAIVAYAVVTVEQTRADTVALAISMILPLLLNQYGKAHGFIQRFLVVTVLVGCVALGLSSQLFNFFLEEGSDYSVIARQYAYGYYFDWFLRSPLFGFGFVSSTSSVASGSAGMAFVSDVAFVGELGQWGLLFLAVFLMFFLRLIFILAKSKRRVPDVDYALMVSFLCYLLLGTMTIDCFGYNLIIRVPIVLAVFEYIYQFHVLTSVSQGRCVAGGRIRLDSHE